MEVNFTNENKKSNLEIHSHKISINIKKLSNYELTETIKKIEVLLQEINSIKVNFKNIDDKQKLILLLKLNDVVFNYVKPIKIISEYSDFLKEVEDYKRIVLHPNKIQETLLKHFLSKIPKEYTYKKFTLKKYDKVFPLASAVNRGSSHKGYFLHIFPKNPDKSYDDIFLIGKCVVFDSGGMDIKTRDMVDMKTDMAGGAILIGVLSQVYKQNKNFNLLLPIVENYIDNTATKPSTVVTTLSKKTVEITDTDAEGRLIIADAIEYFNKFLFSKKLKNPLLLDIATLTGNAYQITCSTSSIIMSNKKAEKYISKLIEAGEETTEFVDYLVLRENYVKSLTSSVADIKNWSPKCKAGALVGGAFIDYFVNKSVPWIHMDIASVVYNNDRVSSYGINLLKTFLEKL